MTSTQQRPAPRDFRKRLLARELLIGTFCKTPTSHSTEILGSLGYDFVMLDEEHAPWTRQTLEVGFLGARAFNIAGLVRVARPDANSILSALDDGAIGVMVPHVASAEKARNIASWARYKGGTRGSGVGRGGDYGGRPFETHYAASDATTTVIAMIEDREALEHIDEIVAVEGIDGFFLGRGDLGLSLSNATGSVPTVEEAVEIVAKAVLKSGKALCAVTQNMASEDAKRMLDLGVTALMVASDQGLLRSGALTQLEHFRKLSKAGT
ncbi:HpcH/HpaI aldolase/citrate lyase family protein [Steroidobacter flavus]|uniref:HpcH/HpaI aldolase/citrate lyase family protein n=1 Tax=Steroidobacter flavus TaxID=1842136 RepID=A0ABV8SXN0_9GAMM